MAALEAEHFLAEHGSAVDTSNDTIEAVKEVETVLA